MHYVLFVLQYVAEMSCRLMLFAFIGVGLGYSVLNSLVGIYYNVIIALALYYLFGSITSLISGRMPWASCDNDWNTGTCGDPIWFNASGKLCSAACAGTLVIAVGFLSDFLSVEGEEKSVQ